MSRNSSTRAVIVCCAAWVCLLTRPALADESRTIEKTNKPTLDQIIDGIERMEKKLFENRSLLIRYELVKTEDIIDSAASGAGLLLVEWTLAYKGEKWFSERRFTQPRRTEKLLVPAKPKTQIAKDRYIVEWDQDSKFASVAPFGEGRNIYSDLWYTRNLSLDAPKFIAQSKGEDIVAIREVRYLAGEVALPFLPEFLRKNKTHYQVLGTPEKVDDALCWVVQWPGMDRFWVDPKRGFAVTRRAYSWELGKPLRFQFYQHDYREVKPGLWLPFTQIEERYVNIKVEKEALWGKVAVRTECRLHSIEFDTLADSFFDVRLPRGTRVIDEARNFRYSVSDENADPFAAPIADAKKTQERPPLAFWLKVIVVASLLLVIVVLLFYRIRSRRTGRGQS
jgi:hypothetical protein